MNPMMWRCGSIVEAMIRLLRGRGTQQKPRLAERLIEIGGHCAALPELDRRSPDEIIGYDEHGVPR